jgi:hypothetical protein
VVFDTNRRLSDPGELTRSIADMTSGSIFYHFIDARGRTIHGKNDFTEWLYQFGSAKDILANRLASVDPYFTTLSELRSELSDICAECALQEGLS